VRKIKTSGKGIIGAGLPETLVFVIARGEPGKVLYRFGTSETL
jgi:hypothetical protein